MGAWAADQAEGEREADARRMPGRPFSTPNGRATQAERQAED